jgi:hypothetical protein
MSLVGRASQIRMLRSNQNGQLVTAKELGVAGWNWLGVRDSNPDNVVQSRMAVVLAERRRQL